MHKSMEQRASQDMTDKHAHLIKHRDSATTARTRKDRPSGRKAGDCRKDSVSMQGECLHGQSLQASTRHTASLASQSCNVLSLSLMELTAGTRISSSMREPLQKSVWMSDAVKAKFPGSRNRARPHLITGQSVAWQGRTCLAFALELEVRSVNWTGLAKGCSKS